MGSKISGLGRTQRETGENYHNFINWFNPELFSTHLFNTPATKTNVLDLFS